jgi:hypothetical protein
MNRIFFLVGFPRSATTALSRILAKATNAEVFVEQTPRLRRDSIDYLYGRKSDADAILRAAKSEAIRDTLNKGKIYGDKNPCLMPFVRPLYDLYASRFVFITRDGRDCVTSLMNWHKHKARNIFNSPPDLIPEGNFGPEPDPWDYSRIRPQPGDPLHTRWHELDRFEKCAWYWNAFNREALRRFSGLPKESWIRLDVGGLDAAAIQAVFDFLELEGFSQEAVDAMLSRRINSVEDRTGKTSDFPRHPDWTEAQTLRFWRQARPMMQALGYETGPEESNATFLEDTP